MNIGSAYTKQLWKKFMDQVVKDMQYPPAKLANGTGGQLGSQDRGTGLSPTPAEPSPNPEPTPTPKPTPTILPTVGPTGSKKPGGGGGGG